MMFYALIAVGNPRISEKSFFAYSRLSGKHNGCEIVAFCKRRLRKNENFL